MKTLTYNAFTFDELSDGAKEKAREWYREDLPFDNEFTYDDAKTQFGFCGFDITRIRATEPASRARGGLATSRLRN